MQRILCYLFERGVSDVGEGKKLHLNYRRICILVLGGEGVDCRLTIVDWRRFKILAFCLREIAGHYIRG